MITRKPFDLPPAVAQRFVETICDYFKEEDAVKRDAIAAHQSKALGKYQNPREKRNLAPMPAVFPDYPAPVVRNTDNGTELAMMRWDMPSRRGYLVRRLPTSATRRRRTGAPG
jgi:hypothetical protein